MDVISFTNPNNKTKMENAVLVEGLSSKMWIERYSTAGEFTFVGPVSKGIKEILPIGSFVSHVNSDDIMIVENHEINEQLGTDPDITVTGRSFETFLDQRIVGINKVFPISGTVTDYSLISEHTWNQAVTLIKDHTYVSMLADINDSIPYMTVLSTVIPLGTETPEMARTVKRESLYTAVLDLLKIDNHGLRTIRPGASSPLLDEDQNFVLTVHAGVDRTSSIVVTYSTGEILNADYLWSNKALKNAALVTGKWVEMVVDPISAFDIEYDRRWMYVDGSDLDKDFTDAPADGDLDGVVNAMRQMGREALLSQNEIILTKAETSKTGIGPVYRRDYGIGDIITVVGDYNETQPMRVSEHVETEDNTGESAYPTLTVDGAQ